MLTSWGRTFYLRLKPGVSTRNGGRMTGSFSSRSVRTSVTDGDYWDGKSREAKTSGRMPIRLFLPGIITQPS
jgi:hypothetical protein